MTMVDSDSLDRCNGERDIVVISPADGGRLGSWSNKDTATACAILSYIRAGSVKDAISVVFLMSLCDTGAEDHVPALTWPQRKAMAVVEARSDFAPMSIERSQRLGPMSDDRRAEGCDHPPL
jgi:hypothetical protein